MPQGDDGSKVADLADEVVTSNDAGQRFGELCTRAQHARQRFVITRHGKPTAAIVSIADLERLASKPAA